METVLIFVENAFEDREFMFPYYGFHEAGYKVDVLGPSAKVTYNGQHDLTIESDLSLKDLNIDCYWATIIPGGRAPDRMRTNKGLVNLRKDASKKGKVIAARCHELQLLIKAARVRHLNFFYRQVLKKGHAEKQTLTLSLLLRFSSSLS